MSPALTGPEESVAETATAGPVDGVTAGAAANGLPGPVLHQDAAQMGQRIREVAARPNIGGYRKIVAALLADHGIDVSHMKVKRVLEKTPLEVA